VTCRLLVVLEGWKKRLVLVDVEVVEVVEVVVGIVVGVGVG
jgi:hypothetical protein